MVGCGAVQLFDVKLFKALCYSDKLNAPSHIPRRSDFFFEMIPGNPECLSYEVDQTVLNHFTDKYSMVPRWYS